MVFNRSYIFNFVSLFEKYNSTTILKYVNKYKHFLESIFRIDFEIINNRDFTVFYALVILAMMFWSSISGSRSYRVIVCCWGKIMLQKERPITFVHPPSGDDVVRSYKRRYMNVKNLRNYKQYLFREQNGLAQLLKSLWTIFFLLFF